MINPFLASMNKRSTKDLKQVIAESQKYTAEAIEAAVTVLKERQEVVDAPLVVAQPTEAKQKKRKKRSFRHFKHYLRFIAFPDFHQIHSSTGKKILFALKFSLNAFVLYLLSLMLLNPLLSVLELRFPDSRPVIEAGDFKATDLVLFTIFMPLIVGLMEELTCRLLLTNFNKKYLDISLSLIFSFLLVRVFSAIMPMYSPTSLGPTENLVLAYLVIAGFAVVIYTPLSRSNLHSGYLEKNWNKAFKGIFYISATIFSILHIPNYHWNDQALLLLPVVLLPYFNYAFLFSLIRIRLGIVYAIGMHALIDLLVVLMLFSKTN
ncbi:MAG: CPBP family glutamic-type intramembrane protease [Imperialibacter sp.]|uniref:type II CAAX prenyl endopeptidase Rce1 family protein n=1 Tax=Imperialibacter sp. TaxID=2038411 RepID=UPI0032EF849E